MDIKNLKFKELDKESNSSFFSDFPYIPLQQSELYRKWQTASDRKVIRVVIERDEKCVLFAQIVVFPLSFKKTYLYIPFGPLYTELDNEILSFLKSNLSKLTKRENGIFCRLDFSPRLSPSHALLVRKIFTKSPKFTYTKSFFQPRSEWVLDISKSEDELLRGMHSKARYGVSYGLKKGLKFEIIRDNLESRLEDFYKLQTETGNRDGFSLHKKDYYENAIRLSSKEGNSFMTTVSYQDKILTMLFMVCESGTVHYVFGGSSNEFRNLMPNNLAQWESMKEAKSRGIKLYNFGAVSSEKSGEQKWDGFSAFKRKFGGFELDHSDFYDLVSKRFWYILFIVRKFFNK